MKFFHDDEHDKLIQLLKRAGHDFRFNSQAVKHRMLQNLDQPLPAFRPHRVWFALSYAAVVVVLLIFCSATFAFASNAKPGDKLFVLNKLGEKVMLSLPLPIQQKAQLRAAIVEKRVQALDAVAETHQLETVKEVDDSFSQAVQVISANRDSLQAKGQTQAAAGLDSVLNQLQDLTDQHEQQIELMRDQTEDQTLRQGIEQHLDGIKKARRQALKELRKNSDDQGDNGNSD